MLGTSLGNMDRSVLTFLKNSRNWKLSLAKELNKLPQRATTGEILTIAEEICPTPYHFGGGYLFLSWFLENGKKSIREWAEGEENWSQQLRDKIREKEVPRWIFSIVTSMKGISQKNTSQLFYTTLVLEWKGLSRTGLDLYATMGGALQAKQYTEMKKELTQQEKQKTMDLYLSRFFVIWVDNFSKIYCNPFLRIANGIHKDCNYTVMSFFSAKNNQNKEQNMEFTYTRAGVLISGSSWMMLTENFLNNCTQSFQRFDNYAKVSYYATCYAAQLEYTEFVVSSSHHHINTPAYSDSPNGMDGMRTAGMLSANISANRGLEEVLQHIKAMANERGNVYQSVVVDPGIYWRTYKVS